MHYLDADKTAGEEARRQLHKDVASNIEQVLAAGRNSLPGPIPLWSGLNLDQQNEE